MGTDLREFTSGKEEAMRRIPVLDSFGRAYATGRRKTAVARVWVTKGSGNVTVNRSMMVFCVIEKYCYYIYTRMHYTYVIRPNSPHP
jgi:hypothetical protein